MSTVASCSCDGSVFRGTIGHGASWAGDESDSKCDISFSSSTHADVTVTPITEEECRAYCGARAGLDGTYRIAPANCTAVQRQAQLDRFLKLYRTHCYPQATIVLQTLIAQCGEL